MQKERIIVDDKNRQHITSIYCHKLLDNMDFDTLYNFAYQMLVDNKSGLTNKMLEEQIAEYQLLDSSKQHIAGFRHWRTNFCNSSYTNSLG